MILYLLFTLTLFISAALLFWIQPLIGKVLLPMLGGTPGVWNTCMLFFQTVLLLGYGYSLLIVKWFETRIQAAIHVAVLLLATLFLPIAVSHYRLQSLPTQKDPTFWLLGTLILAVGMPFFFISANSPLIQKWFSLTRHPGARDPYFLFAAGNLGSFVALLGFPLVLEPNFPLDRQSA